MLNTQPQATTTSTEAGGTGGMTIEQFGQEVKKKYPQYQNIDDATLGHKVLEKYPQYQRALSSSNPSTTTPAEEAARPEKHNLLTELSKPYKKELAAIPALIGGVSHLAKGDVAGASEALTKERNFGIFGKSRPIGIDQQSGTAERPG